MHNIKIPLFSRFTRKRLHIRKGAEASLNALPTVPVNRRYRPAADSRPSNERATAKRPFDMVCIFFFFFPFFFPPLPRMLISILYTHTLFIFIYLKANRFHVTVSLVVVVHLIKTKRHSLQGQQRADDESINQLIVRTPSSCYYYYCQYVLNYNRQTLAQISLPIRRDSRRPLECRLLYK